jgi:hypothetical protein
MLSAKTELFALWRAVFREPPVIDAEPALLVEMIIRFSPSPPAYDIADLTVAGAVYLPARRPS